MTIAIDQRPAAITMSCSRSRSSRSRPTSRRKPPGKLKHPHQRLMLGRRRGRRGGDRRSRSSRTCRECRSSASRHCRRAPSPARGGHEIEARSRAGATAHRRRRPGGGCRPGWYCSARPVISASTVCGDLLGDQPARVPGEIAEQERRKQREHRQIDQRQLERRRAEKLAERRHASPMRRRHPAQRQRAPQRHLLSRIT